MPDAMQCSRSSWKAPAVRAMIGTRGRCLSRSHARIFAVADALDAMISDRPYRRALPISHARDENQRCAGTQFDPKVVRVFLSLPDSLWLEMRENVGAAFRLSHLRDV